MTLPYTSRFESVGACVPESRLSTKELMDRVKMWGKIDLESLTGIRERRVCSKGEDSYTLSVKAAQECFKYSSYKPYDMDLVISCSISRFKDGPNYLYEPPLSLYIKEAIGARRALHFDITNACAGMLTGVMIMDNFIRRGIIERGMVVSGEYITTLTENAVPKVKTIMSKQLASLTLGDCGAAVILERSKEGKSSLLVSNFVTLARWSDLCIGKASRNTPGAVMFTDARKIHQVAIRDMPVVIERSLREAGLTLDDIDHIIPHQTSIRAIRSGYKHLTHYFGVPPRNVIVNLEEFGNTSSTTHFLALYRFLKEGAFKEGERLALIALASGLIIGMVIFIMDDLVNRYGSENR